MNFLKNTVRLLIALCFVATSHSISLAADIEDVPEGFWAQKAVIDCLNRGYFKLDSNSRFYPNGTIERAEFLNSLLKVIESEDVEQGASVNFKDVTPSSRYLKDIEISKSLGMIYGYPDKTFKPKEAITRSEATSVLANISRVNMEDRSVLDKFDDTKEIPGWALNSYAKAVNENLYVNYPDPSKFTPKVIIAVASFNIPLKPTTLTITPANVTLYRQGTKQLHASVSNGHSPVWKSGKSSVATVDENGFVTAVKHGTAKITAKVDGVSKTCTITVKQPKLKLSSCSVSMTVGSTHTLSATVSSGNAPEWSTSNSNVLSVDQNGNITALKKGRAYVYAREDGIKTSCVVTVSEPNA